MTSPLTVVSHPAGSYECYAGPALLEETGRLVSALCGERRTVVVISRRVAALHGGRLLSGFRTAPLVIEVDDSEKRKSLATAEEVIGQLLDGEVRRDSVLIAVGGGVVGDLAGFVAAIYLRGIELVHVPTTLLSQVDSSIGGKVGVNLPAGKNLVGAFHPPRCVIADLGVLSTLSSLETRSGLYEALKTGVIGDPTLFELIESAPSFDATVMSEIVQRAVLVKSAIVQQDEREDGPRRLLNYGHTIGHALETITGYEMLSHGDAVAWGMVAANHLAVRRGLMSESVEDRINRAIARLRPVSVPPVDLEQLMNIIGVDKKFSQGRKVMVLPENVGQCTVVEDVSSEEIRTAVSLLLR